VRPITEHRRLLERSRFWHANSVSQDRQRPLLARCTNTPRSADRNLRNAACVLLGRSDSSGDCESWAGGGPNFTESRRLPPEARVFSAFCRIYAEALTHLMCWRCGSTWRECSAPALRTESDVDGIAGNRPYYNERPWSSTWPETRAGCKSFARHSSSAVPTRGEQCLSGHSEAPGVTSWIFAPP